MMRFLPRSLLALVVMASAVSIAHADADRVRLAKQFGVLYIPLVIMERFNLVEKQAAARGLPALEAEYVQLGTGAAMNDALLSGTLDFVSTGAPSLMVLWDRTRGGVRGTAALNATAQYLLTTRPEVRTIADFSDTDRIAVTSAKISTQAVFLQMGAAKLWGREGYDRLDRLTVTSRTRTRSPRRSRTRRASTRTSRPPPTRSGRCAIQGCGRSPPRTS